MPAAVIQALIPNFTQMGMVTVRMRPPLPSRSASTHLPSSLNGPDVKFGQLVAPEGAADQKRRDHVLALPF
jgi:hypothetical protein